MNDEAMPSTAGTTTSPASPIPAPASPSMQMFAIRMTGHVAYDIGAGREAADMFLELAADMRRADRGRDAWDLVRKAGNALMWAADWPLAQSRLFDAASQGGEIVDPSACFCAMTDLLFMALESEPFDSLEAMLADCRQMAARYGNDSWSCRSDLIHAMLCLRRGYRCQAVFLARNAHRLSRRANITAHTRYAYAKWIVQASIGQEGLAEIVDHQLEALCSPSSASTDALRWNLLQTYRARATGFETVPSEALEATRAGLRMIARIHGIWDERYGFLRFLLLGGQLDEFDEWLPDIPLIHAFERELLLGDGRLARWLAVRNRQLPDWDMTAADSPADLAWSGTAPDSDGDADWDAALSHYQTALGIARLEDERLATTAHQARVGKRLDHMHAQQANRLG